MQKQNTKKDMNILGKRLISIYLVTLMMIASFAGIIPITQAEPTDVIHTYNVSVIPAEEFGDGDTVLVNVSVNNRTGDPQGPPYYIKALNQQTHQWVNVYVSDNNTGPWGDENISMDKKYWGMFNISSAANSTYNASPPGEYSILQVANGQSVNISEVPGSVDFDDEFASIVITANYYGPLPSGNGTVKGYVKDANNTGMPGATVRLNGSAQYVVNTNDSGYFIFNDNVSADHYSSEVCKFGIFPWQAGVSFNLSEDQIRWLNFTVGGGGPPGGGNSSIFGYVRNQANGNPIQGATVELYLGPDLQHTSSTNGSGYYIFNNLSAGTYNIKTFKNGVFSATWVNDTNLPADTTIQININVTLGGGEPPGPPIGNFTYRGYVYQNMTDKVPVEYAVVTIETRGNPSDSIGNGTTDSNGHFEFNVTPNATAINEGNSDATIWVIKDGYEPFENDRGLQGLGENEDEIFIDKIWEITTSIIGRVLDGEAAPIPGAIIRASGDDWFQNQTVTNGAGQFNVGTISGEIGIWISANGYFPEMNDVIAAEETIDLGDITLDTVPPYNAYIVGNITSGGNPLPYAEFYLYDPIHPYAGEKEPAVANATGYFNISTYAGEFYLATMAKTIGRQQNGPPVAVGGYVNEVHPIGIEEYQIYPIDIDLEIAEPDPMEINMTFSNWTYASLRMSRTVLGNAQIVRMMTDTNMNGTIEAEEVETLIGDINASLINPGSFYELITYLWIPFTGLDVDGVTVSLPLTTRVQFSGLAGTLSDSTAPFTLFINETVTEDTSGGLAITTNRTYHGVTSSLYYPNPAFSTTLHIRYPSGYTVRNARREHVSLSALGSRSITLIPGSDPDYNDTDYMLLVGMFVGSTNPSASFNEGYSYENPIDSDGDAKYNWLMKKVKFNTTTAGGYTVVERLKTLSEIVIDSAQTDGTYSSGANPVEFSFSGEKIYMSQENGPYKSVVDLYYNLGDYVIWFDSMNQTTNAYTYSQFDAPPIYFTGEISDYGSDVNNNSLYEYLVINLGVNVGQTGYYEFEGDFGLANYQGGDPYLGHVRQTTTFATTGQQTFALNFDGTNIREKAANGSIWVYVCVRTPQSGQLDSIDHMTEKYFYTDFALPPPENSSVSGNVTDVYGTPIEASIILRNPTTWDENSTTSNGTTGAYWMNAAEGAYELNIGSNENNTLDWQNEYVSLDENENLVRDIKLLPRSHLTERLNIWMDAWQYGAGDIIYINGSTQGTPLPDSPIELTIYRQMDLGDYQANQYNDTITDVTDENGTFSFAVDSTGYVNGDYFFTVVLYNQTQQRVCRDDRMIQISSFALDFSIDKSNYRPGGTGQATYDLTYVSNDTHVEDASFEWGIMYWDWNGEHVVTSDSFVDELGYGTFAFTIPEAIDPDRWYDMRLTATKDGNEASTSRGFGIVTGTAIEGAEDSPVGTQGDYDFLLVNVTVNVTTAGTYRISGGLHSENMEFITGMDNETSLGSGSQIVRLYFSGEQIQSRGVDPYKAWIGLYRSGEWNQLDSMEYILSQEYSHTDFAQPPVHFEQDLGIVATALGPENNYDALQINFTINSSIAGTYRIDGDLHKKQWQGDWWMWYPVDWNATEVEITEGELNLPLNRSIRFEGPDIYNSMQTGPWYVNFNLNRVNDGGGQEWITNWEPETAINYSYNQFTKPAAFIQGIIDQGPDDNEDLWIDVQVNVSEGEEGLYEVNGNLHSSNQDGHQWITNDWNQIELTDGTNLVALHFSGEAIYSKGYNGPYRVYIELRCVDPWQMLGGREFDTEAHNYSDFSLPSAMFTQNYSDEGYDEDGDGYDNYLRVAVNVTFSAAGRYEISGDLFKQVGYQYNWITWARSEVVISEAGEQEIIIDFSGFEIRNKELDGYYGVTLRLRNVEQGTEIGQLSFTTSTYYYYDDFELPAVQFTDDSPINEELSDPDGAFINITVAINSSEVGDYRVMGDLSKVINQGGWQQWIWITHSEEQVTIAETGTTEVTLQFDTAIIRNAGYNGPFVVNINLMDSNWIMLDSIQEYETQAYDISNFSSLPAEFTGSYYDYLSPPTDAQYVKVNVTVNVTQSGNYRIDGSLRKDWRFLAGNGIDQYLEASNVSQNVTLQFDVIEIYTNIQNYGIEGLFEDGEILDFEAWLRRSGEWNDLDRLSGNTYNTYNISDFANVAATIESFFHNGYNEEETSEVPPYDYVNITVLLNFTVAGGYELWSDLTKQSGQNWYWLGWDNEYITVAANDLISTGYYTEEVTLQYSGTLIADYDSPYRYHMELRNLDTGRRESMREGQLDGYNGSDFSGAAVSFVEDSESAVGYDSDDADSQYDYLRVTVDINAQEETNIGLFGDLHKESQYGGWQGIAWNNNWTSVESGTTTMSLDFDGRTIYNSGINGPYQIRLELRNTDTWELLDVIERIETPAYTYDNFQMPSVWFDDANITNAGNDTDSDGKYNYLDVTIPVYTAEEGTYEIMGDLHYNVGGWTWLGWESTGYITLPAGTSTVKLQFDGITIRNAGVSGEYQVRLELRDTMFQTVDIIDPYETQYYDYTDFQRSGAEFVDDEAHPSSFANWTTDDYEYLQLNVTVNCQEAGVNYWVGADLHKESGWQWQWIDFQSEEFTSDGGEQIIPLLFNGQLISNTGIDGPYQIRIELRDTATWTTQDTIQRYETEDYDAADFKASAVTISSVADWGNDTNDSDPLYNYLDLNVTVDCTQAGTYWLNGDLHKQTGYNWIPIAWKGQEITLDDSGNQTVKLQFSGEQIYGVGENSPYQVRLEINNITTWMRYDIVDLYTVTHTYLYTQFQRPDIEFIEDGISPVDAGVGTEGAYTYLNVTVTLNSTMGGTYWLGADIHKRVGWNWVPITWFSQEITHTGTGEENFSLLFDGALIRNSGIDGPYEIRLELRDLATWNQLDIIDNYQTGSYHYDDFAGAGIELVGIADGEADSIIDGNLQMNVTVNSSAIGTYELRSMLYKQEGYNWWYITSNNEQITVDGSGEQTFNQTFNGEDIFNRGLNGPYQVRIELWRTGTWTMVDSIDPYDTNTYTYTQFTSTLAGINETLTEDYATETYLQVNISTYSVSDSPIQYQVRGLLFNESWAFIAWAEETLTIQGYLQNYTLQFDGSIINNSQLNPAKVYIEMIRTSDGRLIDYNVTTLNGTYYYTDFSSGVQIDASSAASSVWDQDDDGYYDTLNVTVDITFNAGDYEITAGLTNQTGTWITGAQIENETYSGLQTINIPFSGTDIYTKGLNGPYVVSFVSVSRPGSGEVARENNVNTTDDYSYTVFEHPDASANLTGTYSSEGWDQNDNGTYEYLNVTVTVDVGVAGNYEFYGDLYSEDGTTWIDGDNATEYLDTGIQTVTLYFEGDKIYASLTDGPYLLGYIRVGATIDSTFVQLDSASNAHTTDAYTYDEFESESVEELLLPSNVDSVSVSNDPFSPNSDGSKDTTLVTVVADASQTLYLNIYDNSNTIKRTGLALSGASTTYTTTWNGKDDSNVVVSDGTYRIKVSDEASGDPSHEATETATVVVDNAAPTGAAVTINNGDTYTNSTSVTLTLTATDESNKKMRFKNNASWSDWEDFQSSKSWTLRTVDGTRTVYYQVKDLAENLATAVTDTITLDTVKPSNVTVTITGGGDTPTTYSNSVSVTLAITAADATSGLYQMLIANDVTFTGSSWETYSTSKSWTLTSGDGVKTVYLKVKDNTGLIADVVSDSITLDTTAPTSLSISIESGQSYTNTSLVDLSLSATGAAKMQFSRNGTFNSTWETYATTRVWGLSSGDGTKTLHFRVKDNAGNIATAVNDTIILDTAAPTFSSVSSGSVSQTGATITWTTNEIATSQVLYGLTTSYGSHTTLDSTKVTSHSQAITGLSAGSTYHYKVASIDSAGNNGSSTDSTFTTSSGVDTTPPSAITGLTVTDKHNAEATLTLSWTASSASDFAAYKVYRKTSSFTNVTVSGVTLITTITSISTTTYDDTTATDDTAFYYAVTAIDTQSPPNENETVTSISGTSVDDKAPTTSDNIPTGWQRFAVTVTLTATDGGTGVYRTYYNTNGADITDPDNRTNYTVPFSVGGDNDLDDGQYTIQYYSVDQNTTPNEEGVHTKTLKVDTTAPSSDDNAPTGWQNSAVTVTLTASDVTSGVSKIFYTTDGSTPGNSSSQYSSALLFSSQGTTTLKYRAKDNATNMESPNTATINIDTTAPTSSVTTLSTYKTSPFSVSWTSSDALSGVKNVTIRVRNGTDGSWTNWNTYLTASGSASYTGTVGYTYYFRSKAYDNATNVESVSGYDAFTTVVSSAPTADISSPSDGDGDGFIYVRGTVTFIGNATDTNFFKYWLNYSADGVTWNNIANSTTGVVDDELGSWNTTGLTEMIYNISLKVKNIGGFFNYYNLSYNDKNVTVDNTVPELSSISSGTPTDTTATITWTTDEAANSTVQYGLTTSYGSTSTSSTYSTSHSRTLSSLSASTTYHYRVISYDKAGNMDNSSDATFTTAATESPGGPSGEEPGEDTGPTISEVSHTPTTVTSSNFVTIYATVTADTGHTITLVTLYWNDGSAHSKAMVKGSGSTYSSEIGPFLDGLTVRYWIIGKDNASRTKQSTNYTFTVVDKAGPTITNLLPENDATISDATPTIQASYSDPSGVDVNTVFITVDGTNVTALATKTTTQISYTPTSAMNLGEHIVIVSASDVKKNHATTTWSFTIRQEVLIVNEAIENISAGETTEIQFGVSDTGVDSIEITAADDLNGATITVERLTEKPTDVTEPTTTNVYAYLNIETTAPEGSIGSIKIKFKVEQTWLTENNIDGNNVVLMRYHNNAWEQLDTTMLNEDATYVYYQATTTGMSTFAIAVSEPIVKPSESQMPLLFIAIIIIVLAVIALVVLLYYRNLI
ncbi:MAG: PGF-pre-PGF domain-containing protein [Thermoplasmata archaeon]|nr:PGF-pre-PGF domain-containing protein [Thermoplasmata archaeon]